MKESPQTSSVKVEKLDEMLIFQAENLTINIADVDKELFLRDPERFITDNLIATKEVVNGLIIDASLLGKMQRDMKESSDPFLKRTVSTWHCISPRRMKSRRIVVTSE